MKTRKEKCQPPQKRVKFEISVKASSVMTDVGASSFI